MAKSNKRSAPKKRGTARKIIITLLIILLIGVLATSITFNVLMYQKINAPTVDKPDGPDKDHVIVTPDPDDPDNPNEGIALLSINPEAAIMSDNVVTVPVTVTPNIDVECAIDWTVFFKNANSEWVTGKEVTDYVTVTPTSDGALSATVSVVNPFSEQILVRAYVRADHKIYKTCTVDYVKKYTFSNWALSTRGGNTNDYDSWDSVFTPNYNISDGTIDDTLTVDITGTYTKAWYEFIYDIENALNVLMTEDEKASLLKDISETFFVKDSSSAPHAFAIHFPIFQLDPTKPGEVIQDGDVIGDVVAMVGAEYTEYQLERLLGLNYRDKNLSFERWVEALRTRFTAAQIMLFHDAVNSVIERDYQPITPSEIEGYYKFNNFMQIKVEIRGEYNNVTTTLDIPLMFKKFTVNPTDLTIDPPSIIV